MGQFYIGNRPSNEPPPIYDLYGVINHHGDILGGHYTAYGRCPDPNNSNKNELGKGKMFICIRGPLIGTLSIATTRMRGGGSLTIKDIKDQNKDQRCLKIKTKIRNHQKNCHQPRDALVPVPRIGGGGIGFISPYWLICLRIYLNLC